MTGFVDRIIPANRSVDRNMKLPICRARNGFEGKSHGETHQNSTIGCGVFARWRRRAIRRKSLSKADNCQLCCCLLKIKFGKFKKTSYISSQNLFKVSKRDGFQDGTLSEICSKIDTLSDRVCHACARKIRNAFELYNFIYSSLQKEKAIEVSGDLSRCKRLLPTTVSSPDGSPQTRKGHKASRENSASNKSQTFGDLPPPRSTTNNITSNTLEEIQEITPSEIAFCVK